MSRKKLFCVWGWLFALCAVLGLTPEPGDVLQGLMTVLAVLSFVPGALILWSASRENDTRSLTLVRNLAALSLLATLVLLLVNVLTAGASPWIGAFAYYVLVVVSSPMVCSGYWALSLFLWACLLSVSAKLLKKK